MVYGKTDGHARCNIPRIADLLEIGVDADGTIEKNMVQNIQNRHQPSRFHGDVSDKDNNKAEIFQGKYLSFTIPDNPFSNQRADKIINDICYHHQRSDFLNRKIELFDQQKDSESHENLPPGTGHKRQEIKEPVFFADDYFFSLGAKEERLFEITDGNAYLVRTVDNEQVALAELGPGDFYGYFPFLDLGHEPYSASVYGTENIEVRELDIGSIQKEYEQLSSTFRNIIENITTSISVTTMLACEQQKKNKKK